jgi:hypothetical protein
LSVEYVCEKLVEKMLKDGKKGFEFHGSYISTGDVEKKVGKERRAYKFCWKRLIWYFEATDRN